MKRCGAQLQLSCDDWSILQEDSRVSLLWFENWGLCSRFSEMDRSFQDMGTTVRNKKRRVEDVARYFTVTGRHDSAGRWEVCQQNDTPGRAGGIGKANKLPWPSAQAQHNYPTVRAASDCTSQSLESTRKKKKKEAMAEHWTGDFKKMGGKAAVRRELRVSK